MTQPQSPVTRSPVTQPVQSGQPAEIERKLPTTLADLSKEIEELAGVDTKLVPLLSTFIYNGIRWTLGEEIPITTGYRILSMFRDEDEVRVYAVRVQDGSGSKEPAPGYVRYTLFYTCEAPNPPLANESFFELDVFEEEIAQELRDVQEGTAYFQNDPGDPQDPEEPEEPEEPETPAAAK